MQNTERKLIKISDIPIIILILLIGFICIFFIKKNDGKFAEIYINNHLYKSVSLENDITIQPENLKYPLTISVKDNKIAVTESNCPTHICSHTGYISKCGESIICIPNMLEIRIIDNNSNDTQDIDLLI